jgi:hypothetical protein
MPAVGPVKGTKLKNYALIGYFLLIAIQGCLVFIYLQGIPADNKNVVFAGYSISRLLSLAATFLVALASLGLSIFGWRDQRWTARTIGTLESHLGNKKAWGLVVLLVAGVLLSRHIFPAPSHSSFG